MEENTRSKRWKQLHTNSRPKLAESKANLPPHKPDESLKDVLADFPFRDLARWLDGSPEEKKCINEEIFLKEVKAAMDAIRTRLVASPPQ